MVNSITIEAKTINRARLRETTENLPANSTSSKINNKDHYCVMIAKLSRGKQLNMQILFKNIRSMSLNNNVGRASLRQLWKSVPSTEQF